MERCKGRHRRLVVGLTVSTTVLFLLSPGIALADDIVPDGTVTTVDPVADPTVVTDPTVDTTIDPTTDTTTIDTTVDSTTVDTTVVPTVVEPTVDSTTDTVDTTVDTVAPTVGTTTDPVEAPSDPASEPVIDQASDAAGESTVDPVNETATGPSPETATDPLPEIVAEDSVTEPATGPSPESAIEPFPEIVSEPAPEAGTDPIVDPTTGPTPETATEPFPEVISEPAPEVVTDPVPEVGPEPSPAISDQIPAPIAEPVPAPVAEPVQAPIAEPVPAPVVDIALIAEPVPAPVVEAIPTVVEPPPVTASTELFAPEAGIVTRITSADLPQKLQDDSFDSSDVSTSFSEQIETGIALMSSGAVVLGKVGSVQVDGPTSCSGSAPCGVRSSPNDPGTFVESIAELLRQLALTGAGSLDLMKLALILVIVGAFAIWGTRRRPTALPIEPSRTIRSMRVLHRDAVTTAESERSVERLVFPHAVVRLRRTWQARPASPQVRKRLQVRSTVRASICPAHSDPSGSNVESVLQEVGS